MSAASCEGAVSVGRRALCHRRRAQQGGAAKPQCSNQQQSVLLRCVAAFGVNVLDLVTVATGLYRWLRAFTCLCTGSGLGLTPLGGFIRHQRWVGNTARTWPEGTCSAAEVTWPVWSSKKSRAQIRAGTGLFQAAEEHGFVHRQVPFHQRVDGALMRRALRAVTSAMRRRMPEAPACCCNWCSAAKGGLNGPPDNGSSALLISCV